jgi:hypothetical protein
MVNHSQLSLLFNLDLILVEAVRRLEEAFENVSVIDENTRKQFRDSAFEVTDGLSFLSFFFLVHLP